MNVKSVMKFFALVGLVNVSLQIASLSGQESDRTLRPSPVDKTLVNDIEGTEKAVDPEVKQLYSKFQKLLTGAKLRGQFTVDGKPLDKLTEETYEIQKVEKQAEGDWWVVTARIKYGERDMVFPVPLEVKWAGSTPVMTLDNMTIPGFGTFGARVVFHKDKYAGTWQHDEVGGHMFGIVEIVQEDAADIDGSEADPQ